MSTSAPFDAGIPVLTEVLQELPAAPAFAPASAPAPDPASVPASAPVPASAGASVPASPASAPVKPAVWRTGTAAAVPISVIAPVAEIDLVIPAEPDEPTPPAVDLDALEQALGERILGQLMPRVDALVAERLEQVLQGLAAGLRADLGASVAQIVTAAVQQELAPLRARKE